MRDPDMSEGFLAGLGRHYFSWSGWVFTVGGAIVGIILAKEHYWILVLTVLTIAASTAGFCFRKQQELVQAEGVHRAGKVAWDAEKQALAQHLRDAERKLNEVPFVIVSNLLEIVAKDTFNEAVKLIEEYADFVARIRAFNQNTQRPINLRVFAKQAGQLHVIAKAPALALHQLRVGDRFLLTLRSPAGIETISAWLKVSQPVNLKDETVAFRIERFIGEEMGHLDLLASSRNVEGMKGYGISPDCAADRFAETELEIVGPIIRKLADELMKRQRK